MHVTEGSPIPAYPFSADRPIRDRSDNRLGRRGFAESLAHAVREWRGSDSLVIALYGQWGSGKSSVKNMTLDALAASQQGDGPLVVDFNPWQFANRDQLTEAFFQEVGVVLGRQEGTTQEDRRKLAGRWRAYAAYLRVGSSLFDVLRGPTVWALFLLAVFFGLVAVANVGAWASLLAVASVAVAVLLKSSSKFAEAVAEAIRARAEAGRRSLKEVKEELADALRALPASLLVVIDDVDRLTPREVQELFQLVKANADFPKLVYLLLFQREVVERSLEDLSQVPGRDFLEKIVQVGFDIPRIERRRLDKILFEGLEQILKGEDIGRRFDKRRWGNLFLGAVRPFFASLRSVYRFLSTLSFHAGLFRGEGSFEVNPVDLIGLEVLRVFEPEIYRAIAQNKELLTKGQDRDLGTGAAFEERQEAIKKILEAGRPEHRDSIREMITQLFPPAEWAFGGSNYGPDFQDRWLRDLRVCSADLFDRYFQFTIPEGDLSQSALDRLLGAVADREALRAELRGLATHGLLGVAMDRLDTWKETIPLEPAVPFITALFDIGEELPEDRGGFFEIAPDMHAIRTVYWYLRRERDVDRRATILRAAIEGTDGLYLPVMLLSLERDSGDSSRDLAERLITDAALAELRQVCVGKFRSAAADGGLSAHPRLAYLLYRWREWGAAEEARTFVEALTQTPEGAIRLLAALLLQSTSQGASDFVTRENWYIRLGNVEDFVAWEVVEERLQTVQLDSLTQRELRAVEAFRVAVRRRREGRPDADGFRHPGDDEP